MSVASSFIKTEVAKKYSFDTKLKYGEDANEKKKNKAVKPEDNKKKIGGRFYSAAV